MTTLPLLATVLSELTFMDFPLLAGSCISHGYMMTCQLSFSVLFTKLQKCVLTVSIYQTLYGNHFQCWFTDTGSHSYALEYDVFCYLCRHPMLLSKSKIVGIFNLVSPFLLVTSFSFVAPFELGTLLDYLSQFGLLSLPELVTLPIFLATFFELLVFSVTLLVLISFGIALILGLFFPFICASLFKLVTSISFTTSFRSLASTNIFISVTLFGLANNPNYHPHWISIRMSTLGNMLISVEQYSVTLFILSYTLSVNHLCLLSGTEASADLFD